MKIFDQTEKYIAITLLVLMTVVVILATLEIAYVVAMDIFTPPGFFIGVEDLFDLFGLFLMVMIGLELMASVHMYLKDHKIHAELMLLVAMTAITRKIVILDAKTIDPLLIFSIGFIVIALSVGYFLISRSLLKEKETT
jgi:uncharacterized membrane protein (DUF373 family)